MKATLAIMYISRVYETLVCVIESTKCFHLMAYVYGNFHLVTTLFDTRLLATSLKNHRFVTYFTLFQPLYMVLNTLK